MNDSNRGAHWENVYRTKGEREVSWFQETPSISLELIRSAGATRHSAIVDIGGGASRLVDALVDEGYEAVTVLDLSESALTAARARLGPTAARVAWIVADVVGWKPIQRYDVWHDRAAFHFLTDAADRTAYVASLREALRPGGHAIFATFALDGPERCSGLPVSRYDAASLGKVLGSAFDLVETPAMTALSGIPSVRLAFSQEESDQRFGTVRFPTSCNETAQRRFDRGMRYQHSFWYRESRGIFEDVIKADPECAIAYWGIALSYLDNPHNPPPPANLPLGLAAIQQAKAIGAKTQRERDFIDALLVFYADYDKNPHGARVQAYLKAIEAVAQRYPDDDEAQLFYGITLNVAASPNDKTYANQLKGAALLEKIFQRQPRHPGIAHYLIHLYDTPSLAEKGLDAAKRYSEIAPAAPHAQHMPTHIFTRVGYWKESIALNTVSARVAKTDKEPIDQLHAMDYLVYAYLQLGQDAKAREVVEEMNAVPGVNPNLLGGAYALAAAPARYMIERNDWNGAAELQVRPTSLAHVEAITRFARALGAARIGKSDAAKMDIAKLAELRDKLREAKDAYWSEQVDIQWQIANAWVLYAEGRYEDALKSMSAAADAENRTEKHPVTPGVPKPANELYGVMLLDRGLAREALAAFEATMKKEPNRLNAFVGAAKAADMQGDKEKARTYYQRLASLASGTDADRPELVAAQQYLTKN